MQNSKHQLWQKLRGRPRLFIAVILGMITMLTVPDWLAQHTATRLIIGWNVTTCLYLVLGSIMMLRSSNTQIQRRARIQDDGKWLILSFVVAASIIGLVAIVQELAIIKDIKGELRYAHIALAVLTIVSSWAFTHMMFGLHYAHEYYVASATGQKLGLEFPGDEKPDYGDFMYFAFVIGTSGQTADVSFSSKAMRRIGLLHCILAFGFNTTVLALTINIAASLIA
jgi:uncharacterized membrane protein